MEKETDESVEKIISEVEAEIKEEVTEIVQKLWAEMSAELELYGSGRGEFTPALLISKIRDYNRKWNIIAETNKFMEPDGFKAIAKKLLYHSDPLGKQFQDALKYLDGE